MLFRNRLGQLSVIQDLQRTQLSRERERERWRAVSLLFAVLWWNAQAGVTCLCPFYIHSIRPGPLDGQRAGPTSAIQTPPCTPQYTPHYIHYQPQMRQGRSLVSTTKQKRNPSLRLVFLQSGYARFFALLHFVIYFCCFFFAVCTDAFCSFYLAATISSALKI